MIKLMAFLIGMMAFTPILAMENTASSLKVILNAPEYWKEEQGKWVQYDLDSKGDLCPMAPREQFLELKYIHAFPRLQDYLVKNENRLPGFDPKMFNLLKSCLQLSYLYQSAENSAEQEGMENEIEHLFIKNSCPTKLVDAVYISRLAGLSLIEKLAVEAFKKREYNGRPISIDDVYPSFDSLDQVGPEKSFSNSVEDVSQDQSSESESESESEESSESLSSSESENEEEINELPSFDSFFDLNNFSPGAFLRSLEKRFTQKKQQKENEKKDALVVVAPLWFLKVNSENEFRVQAANRIKMHEIRIKDAMRAAGKVIYKTSEKEKFIKKSKPEKEQKLTEEIVPKTLWSRLLSLISFILWK